MLLFLAALFCAIAVIVFLIDFVRSGWATLTSLGLAFFAGGLLFVVFDALELRGKL